MVRVGHKIIRRNRHFLKPIDVEAHSPVKQPAQAPPVRPATPQSSAFPVKDDWFTVSGDQKQVNEEDNVSAKRKIRFDEPNTYKENKRPTTTSNLYPDSTPVCNPGTEQAKRSSPMQKQRLERPQLTWPNSIPLTPRKIKKVTETSQEYDKTIPTRLPTSFYSNNRRTNRMTSPIEPTTPMASMPPTTTVWDPNTNWRTPAKRTVSITNAPAQPRKKKKEQWFEDSRWTPPTNATTTTTPNQENTRPRRSNKPVNYNEDDKNN